MIFSKTDFWRAFVAGGLIALLALPIFKNLGAFNLFFTGRDDAVFYLSLALWLIFIPLASACGLYIVYRLTILKRPIFYQIGKYGIIGLLNSALNLAVLNFLILLSGITKGLWFDVFVIIAFWAAVTNAFFWNKFWTFNSSGTKEMKGEYVKFFAVCGATSLINVFLMHILVNVIGAPRSLDPKAWANIASLSLIPVSFFGNFFGWKILVFK